MKDIPGFEGRYAATKDGRIYSHQYEKFLSARQVGKNYKNDEGYLAVHVVESGHAKTVKVHRLVAKAYIPNPKNHPQVNHKDGDKLNNHFSNLEWCDNDYNMVHSFWAGRRALKFDSSQISKIRHLYRERHLTQKVLARQFGASQAMIGLIVNGKCYTRVLPNEISRGNTEITDGNL